MLGVDSTGKNPKMGDKAEKFLLILRVFAEKIPGLISQSDAANLKELLQCLALIHPVFGLVNLFVPPGENQMQKILEHIDRGFEEVNNNIKKLEGEVTMGIESLKVFTAVSHIKTGFDDVMQLQTSINPNSWKLHIKNTHSPTIEKDVNVVLDAMSVFEALYEQSNGDQQKIINLGAVISVYAMSGFIVCETCEGLKPADEKRPDAERRSGYSRRFATLIQTVERYTDMCEEKVSENMESDIERLLRKNGNKNLSENAKILNEFLSSKYDWLKTSVLVYDYRQISGETHSFVKSGNSKTRGQFSKLKFENKSTVVHYYKADGEVTERAKGRVEDILKNLKVNSYYVDRHSNAILKALKVAGIACESIDCLEYQSPSNFRPDFFGIDVIGYAEKSAAMSNVVVQTNFEYFVNLSTNSGQDAIDVPPNTGCIIL